MFGFAISLRNVSIFDDCLFFVNNKVLYFHTLQIMHLPLGLPSLLPFTKTNMKQQKQVTKKFSEQKQPQKPTKLDWDDTTILLLHPYVLCHFVNCAPRKTLHVHITYSHPLNGHGTQHCSLHSLPHRRQPYVPCPAAEFHSIM